MCQQIGKFIIRNRLVRSEKTCLGYRKHADEEIHTELGSICYRGLMKPREFSILTFAPSVLQQLLATRIEQRLVEEVCPGALLRIDGRLGDLGVRRGNWYYGVALSDDSGVVSLDVPSATVRARSLRAGMVVGVTGRLVLRPGRSAGQFDVRVVVADAEPLVAVSQSTSEPTRPRISDTTEHAMVEALRGVPVARHTFPVTTGRPLRISLVHSSSLQAQVTEDCRGELDKLGKMVTIESIPANMTNALSIVDAVEAAAGDVLMLIRGGGDAKEFAVFDDPRVVAAVARKSMYRVIGLGHSGNTTLLDHVVEHAARTPGQAGLHVREEVERRVRSWQAARKAQQAAAQPARRQSIGAPIAMVRNWGGWRLPLVVAGGFALLLFVFW